MIAVILLFELGIFLVIWPWASDWDLTFLPYALRQIWNSNYFRGAVSGLGVLNLYLFFVEVFRPSPIFRARLIPFYPHFAHSSVETQMETLLAQFFAAPIPEPVSLGVVLVGLAVLWFRSSQIVPSTRKAAVTANRRHTSR